MSGGAIREPDGEGKPRYVRLMIVLAGLLLGQVALYGPSLAGCKLLLPLDILGEPGGYLPAPPAGASIEPRNLFLSDILYLYEPARRFAVSELHAGRLPLWEPYDFAGVPFIWPKFSPLLALQYCIASPVVLAWTWALAAIVAGLGAYRFFRRLLAVSFWPAAVGAWCYPLTAFFIFWQGYPTGLAVYWLPWILLAVAGTARAAQGAAPVALSVTTWLVVVSGQLDVAAQVLLISGLFALWCLRDAYPRQWLQPPARKAALAMAAGFGLGLLLAAPYILPFLDYAQSSARMERRFGGEEDHPPVGLAALPQVVLPDMYGSVQTGSFRLANYNEMESSAAAYCGILATLLAAPLACCSRRHRGLNVFFGGVSFLALGWSLNVPGLVQLLRLPGLNMFPHRRLVFAASFAILALAVVGLEVLRQGPLRRRWWFGLPAALLAGLGLWCAYRAVFLPEPVDTQLGTAILNGESIPLVRDLEGVRRVQSWFVRHYAAAAAGCGLGLIGWWLLWSGRFWRCRGLPILAAALVGDLLWFGYGRNAQCDPALYFPPVPALVEVARSAPGRVIGYNCLPANLAAMCGLRDIRGYDGLDPKRLTELLLSVADPQSAVLPLAQTQWLIPRTTFTPEGALRLPPVFDMLDVRYVIYRGSPPAGARPAFRGADYWVMVNSNALGRVFVPHRVETVTEDRARLAKLAGADFDPREVAYVERPVSLPGPARGTASIVEEVPTRVVVAANLETPGLVVLADRWDAGWHAYANGRRVPILRANHALRGVLLPAGASRLEFRYAPASFAWGLGLAGLAAAVLLAWVGFAAKRRTATRRVGSR